MSGFVCVFVVDGNTKGTYLSNLKLSFTDGTSCIINDAVSNKYIEPLVIYSSSSPNASYVWKNSKNILSGGTTSTADYGVISLFFKVKTKSELKGISFSTNKDWVTIWDGVAVYTHEEGYEISTTPLD